MMMRIFFTTLIFLNYLCVFSQQSTIDSLKTVLKIAKNDSTRCRILSNLIEIEYDDKIWPIYNEQLYNLSKKNIEFLNPNNAPKTYFIYYANSINNKGYLAQEYGDVGKALEFYFLSLKLLEQIKDKNMMSVVLNNIAYIYMQQGDFNKSLSLISKSMKLQIEMKDTSGIAFSLNNLGNIYEKKNEITKALGLFQKALKLHKRINNNEGISTCLSNIADVYVLQGKNNMGLDYYLQSYEIRKEQNDPNGMSYNLDGLAKTMLKLGKPKEALKYGLESFDVASKLKYVENIRNASKTLYTIYKKQNNNTDALKMYEIYITMRDSINSLETKRASIKKQFQYDYDKKTTADSIKVFEEKRVTVAQLKQEKTQRFALYGGLLLVGVFGIFMFNRFSVTKTQNHLIHKQKTELQKQKDIVDEHQKETLDSIHYAKRIQNALMANSNLIDNHILNNFIFFQPKDIVSGDFYWATKHNNKFYLAVCDSTGHGVPGAFMSLLNMGFLSEAIKEKNIIRPHEIFNFVRDRLINTISNDGQQDGMDGILICYDADKKLIEYSAANNEPILIRNNEIIELPKDKMPVGKGEKNISFTINTIQLIPGDNLFLYTDGFADQFGGIKGKKFKYKQLNELLLSSSNQTMLEQKNILNKTFSNWKGNLEQVDDVLIIGIKV